MRLIDADLFKEKFSGQYEFMKRVIDDEPTVDAKIVIHATRQQVSSGVLIWKCTNCNCPVGCSNYCPNCGAKLD